MSPAAVPAWVKLVREPGAPYGLGLGLVVTSARGAAGVLRGLLAGELVEVAAALYLDTAGQPLGAAIISRGTVSASLVHAREVYRLGVVLGASSVIVAHNHPSGVARASDDDLAIFKRLREAGAILGITCLDLLVLVDDSATVWSCAENGVAS